MVMHGDSVLRNTSRVVLLFFFKPMVKARGIGQCRVLA
jgi:hypothetical protein